MNLDYHRLPAEAFDALASGGGGPEAIELLRSAQYSKHALLLRGVAAAADADANAAYNLLALAERKDRSAAATVVRYPAVGAWAHRTVVALRGGPRLPGATPGVFAAVAAAAAIRAGLTAEIKVPVRNGLLVLPSLGAAETGATQGGAAGLATVRIAPDRTEVSAASGRIAIPADPRVPAPGWRPLRPVLAGAFDVVVDDVDPFRMPAAPHLAAEPNPHRWRPAFNAAWRLLRRHHPAVAADVAAVITVAVPLAVPPHGQVSSSSPETFGAIAMSEPTDPVSLAVTLAHEVQHMKLSALLDLVPLTRPDNGSRYYAPWREDPRPASGLLQGAYAYLGVTGFWRRQRGIVAEPGASTVPDAEFARWRDATALVCDVLLGSGQLTEPGERFVAMMAATLRTWHHEVVPEQAQRLANEESNRHMARWQARYGPIPSLA